MSYSAVGVIPLSMMKLIAKTAPAIPVIPGTCQVGFPRAGVTPWDSTQEGPRWATPWNTKRPGEPGAGPQWNPAWDPVRFSDHAVVRRCGQIACSISGSGSGTAFLHIAARYWSDAEYRRIKGEESFYRFQEMRVRALLRRLVAPQFGFRSGLQALAYDASFCRPIRVKAQFESGCMAVLGTMNRMLPPGRWQRIPDAVEVVCGDAVAKFSRWKDPLGASLNRRCTAPIMAAPAYCGAGSSFYAIPPATTSDINHRFVPVSAAVMIDGDELAPTPWFLGLLKCFVPTVFGVVQPSVVKFAAPWLSPG